MTKNKTKLTGIWLTEQIHQALKDISEETGITIARLVEDSIWESPRIKEYAKERGIERVKRRRPGRPVGGEE
jgi:hypothetical protein